MKSDISISEAEAAVMQVLWDKHPIASEDVVKALMREHDWQEATIKTLLNRLLNKKALRAEKQGRRYLYSPTISREEWLTGESRGFVDRLFGGRIAPLVAHFSQHKKLSKKDLAELKRIIAEMEDGAK